MIQLKKASGMKEFIKDSILLLFLVATITAFIIRLAELCLYDKYDIADREAYRTVSITETAELRGTIYDANGEVLAYSTPAFNVILSPYDIFNKSGLAEQQAIIDDKSTKDDAREAAEIKKAEILAKGETRAKQVCYILSTLFPDDVDYQTTLDKLTEYADKNRQYYCPLRHIDDAEKNKLLTFINSYNDSVYVTVTDEDGNENKEYKEYPISKSTCVYFESSEKRIYPYGDTTGIVLGYVSGYDIAQNGIEAYYDDVLSGIADRRVAGRGEGSIITSVYDETFEGEDSVSLNTTIDVNIQKILVDAIESAQRSTHAESVYGVVTSTKTGAVLAMANTPGYDSNNPYSPLEIEVDYYKYLYENNIKTTAEKIAGQSTDTTAAATTPTETEEEETEPVFEGTLTERTKNKCIVEPFYPGSIYKAFLVAGALEEGMDVNYFCGGSYTIPDSVMSNGQSRVITCALGKSHQMNDAEHLLTNSCNIAAAQLGLDMGSDLFFKYYEAFGFTEASGVDSFGGNTNPSTQLYYSEYDNTSLATCSFGQNNKVSTIQLAVAMSAIGNGGYILKPYIVASTTDDDGNILSKTETTVKRQAISEKTASTVAEYLKSVVEWGVGTNARLDNYYVSGKTGTSQIKDKNENTIGYVASFAGFAPTTDPEITVVVNIVDPKNESGGYSEILASNIAAPVAGEIFSKTLEYLGIPYDKTAD